MEMHDFQLLGMLGGGNQVGVEVVVELTEKSTGVQFRDEEMHLWTFNDAGKVVRFRRYVDTAKHMKAAGM